MFRRDAEKRTGVLWRMGGLLPQLLLCSDIVRGSGGRRLGTLPFQGRVRRAATDPRPWLQAHPRRLAHARGVPQVEGPGPQSRLQGGRPLRHLWAPGAGQRGARQVGLPGRIQRRLLGRRSAEVAWRSWRAKGQDRRPRQGHSRSLLEAWSGHQRHTWRQEVQKWSVWAHVADLLEAGALRQIRLPGLSLRRSGQEAGPPSEQVPRREVAGRGAGADHAESGRLSARDVRQDVHIQRGSNLPQESICIHQGVGGAFGTHFG
mmetsp:Transcript_75030/g.188880  ORF Transcript_75030/g.188880 Transcript_75030/m.188880 type:complete len:261 (-) Transcript_75030:105-887(-)